MGAGHVPPEPGRGRPGPPEHRRREVLRQAGDQILNRIKDVRGTVILPERTGPIADVLYSAAGNSADEHWYNRGVIAYSFETGADRFGTRAVRRLGGWRHRRSGSPTGTTSASGDTVKVDWGTPNEEARRSPRSPSNSPPSPDPNVTLDAPLAFAHMGGRGPGGDVQSEVGFQPNYATEGKFEALEFAAGNIGLLESAYEYEKDSEPPQVRMTGPRSPRGRLHDVRVRERAVGDPVHDRRVEAER